jgi:outer membrane immunogenic protein
MKKFLIAGAALTALIGTPALAADMALKAPPPPPAPVSNWTGWYAGLNAGYGWQDRDMDNSFAPSSCPGIVAIACATVVNTGNAFLNTFDPKARGFIGGGQIGYNLQTNNTVWGIEADFQGTNIKGSASASGAMVIPGFADVVNLTGTGSQKIDWLGTVRGRLGWTPTPPFLVYATGGLAYGRVETTSSISGNVANDPAGPFVGASSVTQTNTRAGFAVGGGFEWMFAPRWSAKAEYLYYDLGKISMNQTLSIAEVAAPAAQLNTSIQSVAHYNGNIARAGINYHF